MPEILVIGHGSKDEAYRKGVEKLAAALGKEVEGSVSVAYNEFCEPTIEQAIEKLVAGGASHIVAVPTMIIEGGSHSEEDIPEKLAKERRRHLDVTIEYAWPFDAGATARFFAHQIESAKH